MARATGSRRWRLDLPSHEALEGLSQAERIEIVERLNVQLSKHPSVRVMRLVVVAMALVAGASLNWPIAAWLQSLGLGRILAHVIGASAVSLVTVVVGFAVGHWVLWGLLLRAFRGALREVGRDVCAECGYWLRGLDDGVTRCPECGQARETVYPGSNMPVASRAERQERTPQAK